MGINIETVEEVYKAYLRVIIRMNMEKLFTYLVPIGLHLVTVSSQPLGRSDSMVGACL